MKSSRTSVIRKRKQGGKIFFFLLSLCAGAIIFICLLQAEQSALSDYQTEKALIAKENIAGKTLINKDDLNRYFKETEINRAYAVQGFSSLEQLKTWMGQQDTIMVCADIRAKEQIYDDQFFCTEQFESKLNNPVEFCLKVDSYEYSVGGILRAGDLVDILAINPDNQSEIALESVLIIKAFDMNGIEIPADNKELASVAFNVLIEKESLQKLHALLEQGSVRLIKNFSQEEHE